MKSSAFFLKAFAVSVFAFASGALAQDQRALEALAADDANWAMAPKNYANTRFSGLDQINTQNVSQLKMAWSFSVGADRGQEAAPLVDRRHDVCGRALCWASIRTTCSRSMRRPAT